MVRLHSVPPVSWGPSSDLRASKHTPGHLKCMYLKTKQLPLSGWFSATGHETGAFVLCTFCFSTSL
jgi:hypothetical protein